MGLCFPSTVAVVEGKQAKGAFSCFLERGEQFFVDIQKQSFCLRKKNKIWERIRVPEMQRKDREMSDTAG